MEFSLPLLLLWTRFAIAVSAESTSFDRSICQQRPDVGGGGGCLAQTRLFYYDAWRRSCRTFIHSACGASKEGTANRFQTWEACMEACGGGVGSVNPLLLGQGRNPFAAAAATRRQPGPSLPDTAAILSNLANNTQVQRIAARRALLERLYAQRLRRYEAVIGRYLGGLAKGQPLVDKQLVGSVGPGESTCEDLVLNAVLSRRETELYTHQYSHTIPGSRHPQGSTLSLQCTENGKAATTFAYDAANAVLGSGAELSLVCRPTQGGWLLQGSPVKKVYCSRAAPKTATSSGVAESGGCGAILLYRRFAAQSQETYRYNYSSTEKGRHPHGSTVIVTCTEAGAPAIVSAYDKATDFIARSASLTATCNGSEWSVDGRRVEKAYCSTRGLNASSEAEDDACADFSPSIFPARRGLEFYDFQYASTEDNRWHPANSSLSVRCTIGGIPGLIAAFDAAGTRIATNFVQSARCDGERRDWVVGETPTPFARILCQGSSSVLGGLSGILGHPGERQLGASRGARNALFG